MLGHSHALSGACTGTLAGIVLGMPPGTVAELAVLTAGMALVPDLDSCGSCAARSLGLISETVAYVVRFVCRGHRHLTHAIIGAAAFTALAWAAGVFRHDLAGRIVLGLILTIAVSGGLEALHITDSHTADILGVAAAAAVTFAGYGLALVPLAAAVGCLTHIAGDMCTDSGVMLLYPFSKHRFHLLREPLAFTTGTDPELMLVDPLLCFALAGLAVWVADPAVDTAAWARLLHVL